MVARFVGRGMVVAVEVAGSQVLAHQVLGQDGARTVVDLWGTRVAVRGAGRTGERRKLCLHVEDLTVANVGTTGAIQGRVVAVAYQGATTLLTIQPDAANAPQLKAEAAGDPPVVGAAVAVALHDGWIIPERGIP
jgi:hypothetical protein